MVNFAWGVIAAIAVYYLLKGLTKICDKIENKDVEDVEDDEG